MRRSGPPSARITVLCSAMSFVGIGIAAVALVNEAMIAAWIGFGFAVVLLGYLAYLQPRAEAGGLVVSGDSGGDGGC